MTGTAVTNGAKARRAGLLILATYRSAALIAFLVGFFVASGSGGRRALVGALCVAGAWVVVYVIVLIALVVRRTRPPRGSANPDE
jgi:hypothetical protein